MNINEQFPSKYLKASDLRGEAVRVKISDVVVESISDERKMIMYFAGKEKGMVLNKTNARTIGDSYGDDTDEWIGNVIEVFAMKVDFQGRMVDGLRVRVPPRRPATAAAAATQQPPARPVVAADGGLREELDDEIPF